MTGINITLRTVQISPVRGRIAGVESGTPVEVSVVPSEDATSFSLTANPPEYRFDFGRIEGGKFMVEARFRVGDKAWSAEQPIDTRHPMGEIVLTPVAHFDRSGPAANRRAVARSEP